MFFTLHTDSFHKMKFSVICVLFLIKLCVSNDIECGHSDSTIESLEFYCTHFNGTLPVNCSKSFSVANIIDKLKVTQLKIGGCDYEKVKQIVGNFRNLRYLDISKSGITSLDSFNHKHLIKLNASHNRLSSLRPETFANLLELEYLDLSYNFISNIGFDRIFSDNHKLKTLRLENNRINEFDWRFFPLVKRSSVIISWENINEFKIIESLDKPIRIVVNDQKQLSTNQYEGLFQTADGKIELQLHPMSFKAISKFKIHNNHIENPAEILSHLSPSLEFFELTGSCTEKMSLTLLEPFTSLIKLTLKSMLMDFDASVMRNHTDLVELDISNNNLTWINGAQFFENIKDLLIFKADENQLLNTPELIKHLASGISTLKLSGNFIGKLNATTFERFTNLMILDLSKTNLSFDELRPFEPLRKLDELDISHNDLENSMFQNSLDSTNFEPTSMTFIRLHRFYAANCKIRDALTLTKLFGPPLSHLDLSGNDLQTINANTFENIGNLHILNLSNTNLLNFNFNTTAHEIELVTVDLSNNKLERIDMSSAPEHLQSLFLNGNELKEISNLTKTNIPRLTYLNINGNQLSCEYLWTHMPKIVHEWPQIRFVSDSWEQKHKQSCIF